ncbi:MULTISPECIES: hypothetical protein [unclassified Dyella]|uniref:hypothetical protein n=1 Tax=unclassified Dyella TaxID=2634549 RepID=UPI000CC0C671|nr:MULTISPECIES: hypothetical protein [unclassified Dyella]MDR3445830.1 hypothetical protein [Dyella sp.]PMQ04343.1 hypothetical protein DyAD56_15185 [Dyella sp. AD56]
MPFSAQKKISIGLGCLIGLPVLLGATYVLILSAAKLEWGGSRPNEKLLGTAESPYLRNMDQYCTGVTTTPASTWLVGKMDDYVPDELKKLKAVDIDALLQSTPPGNNAKDDSQADSSPSFSGYALRDHSKQSYISRLDDAGHFKLVATVGEDACLITSADGAHVFLLTGLDAPGDDTQPRQSAVFRSDDQGKSWQWLKDGFFPQANLVAWAMQPQFFKGDQVWVWVWDAPNGDTQGIGLFYSADLGKTVVPVETTLPVAVSDDEAQKHLPADASISDGDAKRVIRQLDDTHAIGWLSQYFDASWPDSDKRARYSVTTRVQLSRDGNTWKITSSTRDDGLYLEKVTQNTRGDFFAVTSRDQRNGQAIERFNAGNSKWEEQGSLPSPFWPLDNRTTLRSNATYTFSVGDKSIVVTTDSAYNAPRLFTPFDEHAAHIYADANYYSTNGGRSWKKLGLQGSEGILGFDPAHDRVMGAHGDGYSSRDPNIYTYDLAP